MQARVKKTIVASCLPLIHCLVVCLLLVIPDPSYSRAPSIMMTGGEDNDRDPIKNNEVLFPDPPRFDGAHGIALNACEEVLTTYESAVEIFTFVLADRRAVRHETLGSIQTFGELFDELSSQLRTADDGGGTLNFLIVATLNSGRCFVRITGARTSQGDYTLSTSWASVTDVAEDGIDVSY